MIKATVTGVAEAIASIDAILEDRKAQVEKDLAWFGETVSQAAKSDHPYKDHTGNLTASIGWEISEWNYNSIILTVFAMAAYAEEVEFGTARAKPYPFLYPKFYMFVPQLEDRLQASMDAVITENAT